MAGSKGGQGGKHSCKFRGRLAHGIAPSFDYAGHVFEREHDHGVKDALNRVRPERKMRDDAKVTATTADGPCAYAHQAFGLINNLYRKQCRIGRSYEAEMHLSAFRMLPSEVVKYR